MDALILMTKFGAPIKTSGPKKHVAYVVWRGLSLDTKLCFFFFPSNRQPLAFLFLPAG